MHPLISEAMKKAAVVWLTLAAREPYPVWCLWTGDALLVVSGPGEQAAPGLAEAATAVVTARGDHGGSIVSWPATVERIEPDTDGWAAVPQLAAQRLNSDPADDLAARLAAECVVSRLTPTDDPLDLSR